MYLKYLWYIIKHKFYVAIECWKVGLYWQGLFHDWHKFLPSEFIPYARYFYGKGHTINSRRDKTGYWKPGETPDDDFNMAWFFHQKRAKHHWQSWIFPADNDKQKYCIQSHHDLGPDFLSINNKQIAMFGDWLNGNIHDSNFGMRQADRDNSLIVKNLLNRPDVYVLPIPEKYLKEMICDWIGAGKAQGMKTGPIPWWKANNHKMILHENTRDKIEEILEKFEKEK